MKNIVLYTAIAAMMLGSIVSADGQIIKVDLIGNNLCNDYLEVGIYVRASDFSSTDFEIGSSSFFFNYNPAVVSFADYTPAEFDATTSAIAAGANWIDQAITSDNECGLLSLVVQKEDGGLSNYELNKVDLILVGTVLMQFVNGEADPDIRINERFTMFNSAQTNDGTAMIAVEDYPKVQNYACFNNCTPAFISNISTNATSCTESTGFIAISFPDDPDRTNIEFSIDGGFTFPYNTLDDVGTYEITGLSAASFDLWVRWGDDSCPYNLGPVSINAAGGPEATIASVQSACGETANGGITLEFPNHPTRTNIEFSLDGGLNYLYNSLDSLLTFDISGLAPDTYDLWVRWGDDSCPVDMADPVIYASDIPAINSFRDYDVCDQNELGALEFEFEDHPSYSAIEISVDGGQTYPYSAPDNQGIYLIDGLSMGYYSLWVRWNDESCPTNIGNQTLSIVEAPIATVVQDNACVDSDEGELVFTFPDHADRTGIAFSINGGQTYQYTQDNLGTYVFDNLPPGTYDCWARWGDDECATFIQTSTIGINESPVAAVSVSNSCNAAADGAIVLNFPDHPTRTGIQFSIDGGTTYQYTNDDVGAYTFNGLTPGIYPVWIMWGDEDCQTYLEDAIVENSSVLQNGDFADQSEDWYVYVNTEATSDHSFSEEYFSVDIANPGSAIWHTQLMQVGIPIVTGDDYQISFKGRAAADRQMYFQISKSGPDDYSGYYGAWASLTTNWQTFNYTITSDSTDSNSRLVFSMGLESADIDLDDISIINLNTNTELVLNGNFAAGNTSWWTYTNAEATTTYDYVNEQVFSTAISNPGTARWHVQLIQNNVPIINEHNYEITFRARAEQERLINLQVTQNGPDDWSAYYWAQFPVTTQWETYTHTFVSDSTDAYARLVFDLGLETPNVEIDDITFTDLDCGLTAPWVTPELCLTIEGAYDLETGIMRNTLQQSDLLPEIQPYNQSPWNYEGNEGLGWTSADYPSGSVDWVLVSYRTATSPDTEIARTVAILQQDGCLYFPDEEVLSPDIAEAVYVVIHHRNHMPIMTPQAINIIENVLTYDFRSSNSYSGDGFGQKQLEDGTWAMYAGECDQTDPLGYDINGLDNILWISENGTFDVYFISDMNLDGDINGADKILWNTNNGISSGVPK